MNITLQFVSLHFKLQGRNRRYKKLLREYLAFSHCTALIGSRLGKAIFLYV